MSQTTTTSGKREVDLIEDMDRATFLKHMNFRHADSLGYGDSIPGFGLTEYVEHCWRAFHNKIHELRLDIRHEHS
jgi:hypothetical protein